VTATVDVWALWAHIEEAFVDNANFAQWRKRLRAFMKAKGEHFEHLL